MNSLRSIRRSAGTAAVAIGVLSVSVVGTGTAYAFWTVMGSGTGTADATTAAPVTVSIAVAGGQLYPGASLSAKPTFTNPNPFPVSLRNVTATDITITGATGCTKENSAVTFATLTGPWTVPAKTASGNGTFTPDTAAADAVTMGKTSDSACQGATFTATLTVTGESS